MHMIQMALAVVLVCGLSQSGRGDAIERMRMEKLRDPREGRGTEKPTANCRIAERLHRYPDFIARAFRLLA